MMHRLRELHQKHESHLITIFLLMFVTNCRYLGMHQPNPECAWVPLTMQSATLLATLASMRGARSPLLKAVALAGPAIGGVTSVIFSLHHLQHLLQATVSILNAYVLCAVGFDLWIEQDNEAVVDT